MEPQIIFNLMSGGLLVGVGWWCREIWDSVKSLKDDVQRMEVDFSKNYVSRSEINGRLDKIDQVLGRIFDKLENKADK